MRGDEQPVTKRSGWSLEVALLFILPIAAIIGSIVSVYLAYSRGFDVLPEPSNSSVQTSPSSSK